MFQLSLFQSRGNYNLLYLKLNVNINIMTKSLMTTFKLIILGAFILGGILLFQQLKSSNIRINRDRAAVITQIKQLNKLETTVFSIEKIIDAHTSGNAFQRLLFGDNILLIAHGKVVAGIDLSQLNEDQINISDQSISITLPASEIFNSDLDESQTEVYDRTQGFLTKGNKNLESEARKAAEEEIRQAACEGGILTTAATSAKQQITALLQALNFTQIEVKVEAGKC
jgi:hypothetical protein